MRAIACSVSVGLMNLAAAGSAADWSQWRGDADRNGVVDNPAPVFADPPASIALEEVWQVPMPGEAEGNYSSAESGSGGAG